MIVDDLTSSDPSKPTCFAVSTDASNLKNRKMFPICVQYFNIECGVNKKLIVFDEQNDECSVAVGEMLKTGLNKKLALMSKMLVRILLTMPVSIMASDNQFSLS